MKCSAAVAMRGCAVGTCKALLCTLAVVSAGQHLALMQGILHIHIATVLVQQYIYSVLSALLLCALHISMKCKQCLLCVACNERTCATAAAATLRTLA
jgi:hypothetical protein